MNKKKYIEVIKELNHVLSNCPKITLLTHFPDGVGAMDWLGIVISAFMGALQNQLEVSMKVVDDPDFTLYMKQFSESLDQLISTSPLFKSSRYPSATIN